MTKQLTEKQSKFLQVLFNEAQGDYKEAKRIAGYSDGTAISDIVGPIKEEIAEKLRESLSTIGSMKSYKTLMQVLDGTDDPLGRKERITVARDLLDRAGHKATDKVEVSAPNNLFILPPKEGQE